MAVLFSWYSKRAPKILIFSIVMGADNSFYVKSIATCAPTFFRYLYHFSLSQCESTYSSYLPLGSQQLTAAKYMSLSRKTLAIDSMIFAERMQSASQGA